MNQNKRLYYIIILVLFIVAWLFQKGSLSHIQALQVQVPNLIKQIQSYPAASSLILFGLAVFQSIVPVIPFFLVAGTSGALFGMGLGVLLVWSGAVVGALAVFLVVRYLGREKARSWLAKSGKRLNYTSEQSFLAIMLGRLIPIVPSSVVNVVCGLSGVRTGTFFLATALGKLPWALLYTSLGYNLKKGNSRASLTALLLLVIMLAAAMVRWPRKTI